VASWFGRNGVGFREGAREPVLSGGWAVQRGARRGWHRVAGTLPCRCWCRVRLGGVRVHGNT
jgi:hypothetical protein